MFIGVRSLSSEQRLVEFLRTPYRQSYIKTTPSTSENILTIENATFGWLTTIHALTLDDKRPEKKIHKFRLEGKEKEKEGGERHDDSEFSSSESGSSVQSEDAEQYEVYKDDEREEVKQPTVVFHVNNTPSLYISPLFDRDTGDMLGE